MESNVFETLNKVDVGKHIEKKNGLPYLSWSFAWQEVKKHFPDTSYTVYENANGLNYHTDGMTAWVKVGVTIKEMECIEYLPVMDFINKSIQITSITSMDVNKAIQRALTKAIARHGLGLYIYAGEDLPEAVKDEQNRLINDDERNTLATLIQDSESDLVKFNKAFMITKLSDMPISSYEKAKAMLQSKINKMKKVESDS